MKNVFVVDDEKLVRQGIIATFPWSRYGFQVVGEAPSGEKALEGMAGRQVDLLLTDLTMPGMSGFELIRRVRATDPALPIVVLTCHDSFKSIQEAMRLGVIDYIVKTEIVDEMVEETLGRIAEKLQGGGGERRRGSDSESAPDVEEGVLLCRRGGAPASANGRGAANADVEAFGALLEIDRCTWLLAFADKDDAERGYQAVVERLNPEEWVVARVKGIRGRVDEELAAKLRRYRWRHLFYAFRIGAPVAETDVERLSAPPAGQATEFATEGGPTAEAWGSPTWVNDDAAFERLLRLTGSGAVDPTGLKHLFYHVALEWDRLLGMEELPNLMVASERFLFWIDWEEWLQGFREALRLKMNRGASSGIREAVAKAIRFIREAEDLDLNEADVARQVSMSRGYFSTCFKKVTGRSFGDYLKQVKLEKARLLILRTDDSITLTAEKCGFRDYRYFSRVFREYTGMLPNEYRRSGGKPGST